MKNKLILYFIIIFTLLNGSLSGQKNASGNVLVLSDSTLQRLKVEKPYKNYVELTDNNSALLEKIQNWLTWFFGKLFGNKVSYSLGSALPYLIIVLLIIVIALKFAGLSMSTVFKPSIKKTANNGYYSDDMPIYNIDFCKLINQALNNSDFRMAIRYSYLKLLQELDAHKIIAWEKQKSNYDYLIAVNKSKFFTEFKHATLIYENAWYGEMPWKNNEYQNQYQLMIDESERINQLL